jgi:hypothetical protein
MLGGKNPFSHAKVYILIAILRIIGTGRCGEVEDFFT